MTRAATATVTTAVTMPATSSARCSPAVKVALELAVY
ncbi:hypothetical protein H4W33_006660 [Kibdelosporangium phytohabitans]|nr:hypothetical protein [Kibdelosporangium phytohabitans]